jgi:hypothetical protein
MHNPPLTHALHDVHIRAASEPDVKDISKSIERDVFVADFAQASTRRLPSLPENGMVLDDDGRSLGSGFFLIRIPSMARPLVCTPELLTRVCARLAAGESLSRICRGAGMPAYATVVAWLMASAAVRAAFARARRLRAELLTDEVVALADDIEKPRSAAAIRLRIEARKWTALRWLPSAGVGDPAAEAEAIAERLAAQRRRLETNESEG